MPDIGRRVLCKTHLLGERHRYHQYRACSLAWFDLPREILPKLCYGWNCENWWGRACAGALQDNALFVIIEMGGCSSIMFDTIFDGNEKQDLKTPHSKACISWSMPRAACRAGWQGWVTTWGSRVPPEIPWAALRSSAPSRSACGAVFGRVRGTFAVSFEISSNSDAGDTGTGRDIARMI